MLDSMALSLQRSPAATRLGNCVPRLRSVLDFCREAVLSGSHLGEGPGGENLLIATPWNFLCQSKDKELCSIYLRPIVGSLGF